MLRAHCQPWERWCYETHNKNCSCRKYNSYLGIWPNPWRQSHARWVIGRHCGNSYTCHQGKHPSPTPDFYHAYQHIATQIQASGQRIEYFHSTQLRCGLPEALKIPLHSNIRWGTAYKMLDQANKLRQVSIVFSAIIYGANWFNSLSHYSWPQRMSCTVLLQPYDAIINLWSIYHGMHSRWLSEIGFKWLMHAIYWEYATFSCFAYMLNWLTYQDSNRIQQYFSSEKQPTLWRALPALEELQSMWEKKHDNPKYALYKDALTDGLEKLQKYYSRLDKKPSFVLALGKLSCPTTQYKPLTESLKCFIHITS